MCVCACVHVWYVLSMTKLAITKVLRPEESWAINAHLCHDLHLSIAFRCYGSFLGREGQLWVVYIISPVAIYFFAVIR